MGVSPPTACPKGLYSYDSSGIRYQKVANGKTYTFTYVDGDLIHQTDGTNTWWFYYDHSGKLVAMDYNGTLYYYMYDSIGNIFGLVDANGAFVANYTYDAWGKILSSSGSMAEINPIRYKGYYYDTESGFYYLMSRYYDPVIGRFLNADSFASTGQGVLGYNMYAYCGNNPILFVDYTGQAKVAVLYDGRSSGILGGYIGGIGFERQGSLIAQKMQRLGYIVESYAFYNIGEFVLQWNSMSGEYDYIIIAAHGAPGSLDCSGQRIRYQNGDYSFSDLQEVSVNRSVHLYSCNGGTIDGYGTSVAKQLTNLTNAPTTAVKDGKMNLSWSTGDAQNAGGKMVIILPIQPGTCYFPQLPGQPNPFMAAFENSIIVSTNKSIGARR